MSAPRTRAEPLNLVDGRFPGSGSSPGAEGSSLLCRLSICLSTCVYVTRTDPLDNNCLLRSRVVRSFKPFGHNFVRTNCLPISLRPPSLFDAVFIFRDIVPPPRRHCSQSVENIFFFHSLLPDFSMKRFDRIRNRHCFDSFCKLT